MCQFSFTLVTLILIFQLAAKKGRRNFFSFGKRVLKRRDIKELDSTFMKQDLAFQYRGSPDNTDFGGIENTVLSETV